MHTGRVLILMVISLVLVSNPATALKVFPTLTELGDRYEGEQNYILTILNDGPRTDDVTLTIDYESFYLEPYVKLEPSRFTLPPNSKKNIQVTTNFPADLSPEKHVLIIQPMTEFGPGERSMYSFNVPGIPRPDLRIADAIVTNRKDSVIIEIELQNLGNVIARSTPIVHIHNLTNQLGKIEYESRLIILPYTSYNITLMYDARDLKEGDYMAKLQFRYNENAMTNLLEKNFVVSNKEGRNSLGILPLLSRIKLPLIAVLVLFLAFFSIKPEYLKKRMHGGLTSGIPKEYRKRISDIDMKMRKLEDDTDALVSQTQGFIRESNQWFDSRFGKGTFEFK